MKKTYEGLFIFLDTMTDDAVAEAAKVIPAEIEKAGGSVVEKSVLGRRAFSRPLHKKEAGCYLQVIFELDPTHVADVRGRLRLHDDIFRTQIVVMSPLELAQFKQRKTAPVAVPPVVEEGKNGVA